MIGGLGPSAPFPGAAVTGMGIVCSVGHDVESLRRALAEGHSGIDRRPALGDPPGAVSLAAVIRNFSLDQTLGQLALEPDLCERARRLARRAPLGLTSTLAAVLEAWSQAALDHDRIDPERIAVVVGGNNLAQEQAFQTYAGHGREVSYVSPRYALEFWDTNFVGVISELLGTRGEGGTVGGASASGALALIRGHQLLALDLCDVCVVACPMSDLSAVELRALHNAGAMHGPVVDGPTTACRPFDRDHKGFVYGQASACVILERPALAHARAVPVIAEMCGGAVQLDASSAAAPTLEGEARAMNRALQQSGITAAGVDYVNAHGSGSPLGDRTEVAALKQVFGPSIADIDVNSTKSIVGHCMTSAGLVEAIATTLQLRDQFVHATVNLDDPIDDDCRFVQRAAQPRSLQCGLSNSFAFGGFSTSLVLRRPEV